MAVKISEIILELKKFISYPVPAGCKFRGIHEDNVMIADIVVTNFEYDAKTSSSSLSLSYPTDIVRLFYSAIGHIISDPETYTRLSGNKCIVCRNRYHQRSIRFPLKIFRTYTLVASYEREFYACKKMEIELIAFNTQKKCMIPRVWLQNFERADIVHMIEENATLLDIVLNTNFGPGRIECLWRIYCIIGKCVSSPDVYGAIIDEAPRYCANFDTAETVLLRLRTCNIILEISGLKGEIQAFSECTFDNDVTTLLSCA